MSIDDVIEKFARELEAQWEAIKEVSLVIGRLINRLDSSQYVVIESCIENAEPGLEKKVEHLLSQ